MTGYRDVQIDTDAIVEDIRCLAAIESPTSHPAGVNAVLDLIASWFMGSGATCERLKIRDGFGDLLKVQIGVRPSGSDTVAPGPDGAAVSGPAGLTPGILVLSHVDTVHP